VDSPAVRQDTNPQFRRSAAMRQLSEENLTFGRHGQNRRP
jgi:hypothetical protein